MTNLAIRNLAQLGNVWQGGAAMLYDKDLQGLYSHVGNISKADFEAKPESTDFDTAMATGVLVTEGKPIKKLNIPFNPTINAPSLRTLDAVMFGSGVNTWSQASATGTTQPFTINAFGVWYKLNGVNLSSFTLTSGSGESLVTYVAGTDYIVDTELGAFMPVAGAGIAASTAVTATFNLAAVSNFPELAPQTSVRFSYGRVIIYMVVAANEARTTPEVWLRYIPKARVEPSGKFDFTADKPGEVQLVVTPVPSGEIANQPFGYLHQIGGTARAS